MVDPDSILLAQSIGETFASTAASGPILLALGACILAGLVSFASPCVVPLVPGYMAYLASVIGADKTPPVTVEQAREREEAFKRASGRATAVKQASENGMTTLAREDVRSAKADRRRVVTASLLFVAGFTVVFVALSAMVLGTVQYLAPQQQLIERIGGVITIAMGLIFIGLVPALQRDTRLQPKAVSTWVGAPTLGAVFAMGWTPCLGPTLAAALSVAAGSGFGGMRGVMLIVAYCIGLGLPFVLFAFGSTWAVRTVGWLQRNTRKIQIFGGVLLVIVGVLLLTGMWALFVDWLRDFAITDTTLFI